MTKLINFNKDICRFELKDDININNILNEINLPLSVILQITRRCPFSCVFCSETEQIPDPSLEELVKMRDNLEGASRLFLSGGEPLIRKDFKEVVDIFYGNFILGLPTNAVASESMLRVIKEKIDFVNVGLEGPRSITSRVRGDYDLIMKGIYNFIKKGIPFSLTCVVLRSTMESIILTCQMADVLGAKKLKLILPIPKGNALKLSKDEYLSKKEGEAIFNDIKTSKEKYDWRTKITFTIWTKETEGYSLLIYPNGETYAWPVFHLKDKVLPLGNILNESIKSIWERYPYKLNHIKKYLGHSIYIC